MFKKHIFLKSGNIRYTLSQRALNVPGGVHLPYDYWWFYGDVLGSSWVWLVGTLYRFTQRPVGRIGERLWSYKYLFMLRIHILGGMCVCVRLFYFLFFFKIFCCFLLLFFWYPYKHEIEIRWRLCLSPLNHCERWYQEPGIVVILQSCWNNHLICQPFKHAKYTGISAWSLTAINHISKLYLTFLEHSAYLP